MLRQHWRYTRPDKEVLQTHEHEGSNMRQLHERYSKPWLYMRAEKRCGIVPRSANTNKTIHGEAMVGPRWANGNYARLPGKGAFYITTGTPCANDLPSPPVFPTSDQRTRISSGAQNSLRK